MLVGDQIGNAPSEQAKDITTQAERFLDGCGGFHRSRRSMMEAAAYTTAAATCKNLDRAVLGLRGQHRGVGHDDDTAHDRVDATLVRVPARRQVGNSKAPVRFHCARIEGASASSSKHPSWVTV